MICVIKDEKFKQTAKRLNVSEAKLEEIVHKYINSHPKENFPSDDYINDVFTKDNIVSSDAYDASLSVWEDRYSTPIEVSTIEDANKVKDEMSDFFSSDNVVIRPLHNGQYRVTIAMPKIATSFRAKKKDTLATKYNENRKRQIDKALEDHLRKYLAKYHFRIKEQDMSELFGDGVYGAIDILHKVIYLAKEGRNKITFPEEFAHAFVELMGAVENSQELPSYDFLAHSVEHTSIYKQVYDQYKDIYTLDNGKPDVKKIRKEAIGQALAAAIVNQWDNLTEDHQDNEDDKGFLSILKRIFNYIVDLFKATDNKDFSDYMDELAQEILGNDYRALNLQGRDDWQVLDFESTLARQNAIDGGIAVSSMQYFSSTGHIITGSISYRKQGILRRKGLDTLHDIDMIAPKSIHDVNLAAIADSSTTTEQRISTFLNSNYAKKILKKYPSMKFFTVYSTNGTEAVASAVYTPNNPKLADKFASLRGSYEERLKHFSEEERAQIYLYDFFLESDDTREDGYITDEKTGIKLSRWQNSFEAKLKYGRIKDVMDYQDWIPEELYAGDTLSDNVMYQRGPIVYNKEQQEAIDAAVAHIRDVYAGRTQQKFFTIQGKAGTGKTTIVNEIIKQAFEGFSTYQRPYVIMGAPSHKATAVLKGKVNDDVARTVQLTNKTVAGMLGLKPNNSGEYVREPGKIPPINNASLVIIDEASMVNEEHYEMIKEAVERKKIAVLFIGDVGQLPPVRTEAFRKKYKVSQDTPSPAFADESIPTAKLLTRIRQGESSPVLDYADQYWDYSQEQRDDYPNDLNAKSKITDEGALIVQNGEVDMVKQLLPLFEEAKRTGNPNLVKIVPYTTNSRDSKESAVDKYNRRIREQLYPGSTTEHFEIGDLIIFNDIYGDETGSIPNSFESAVTGIRECESSLPKFDEDLGLQKVERIYLQFSTPWGTSEVPALVPTLKNRMAHINNIRKIGKYCNKHPRMWPKYWEYKNLYAANIGYAYAIDSHKSQGSTYDVVAVDTVDINSVQLSTLKTKAQSIYTALTRASNVTIVSSNTTNESTIYTDIKAINDRINAVKNGEEVDDDFIPATEEGLFPQVEEKDIPKLIKDPSKKKTTSTKSNAIVGTIDTIDVDERKLDAQTPDVEEEEALDWDDDASFKDDEEPEKPAKPVKKTLTPQERTYQNFIAQQSQLNNIISFNEKYHIYKVNGRQADFSVTEFKDFVLDIEKDENDYLEVSSRLGTSHDAVFRDFFGNKSGNTYLNLTRSQVVGLRKEALKLKKKLIRQLSKNPNGEGEDLIFITDEELLRVAATVNYEGKDYVVAGTMDMAVIDADGNITIVDFKTKRANITQDLKADQEEGYALQVSLYGAFATSESSLNGKLKETEIAQFNLKYSSPDDYEYSFKNQQVQVEVGNEVVNIEEAEDRGNPIFTPGRLYKVTSLSTDLNALGITVSPVKTSLQQRAESKNVAQEAKTEPAQFKGNMTFWYGNNKRKDVKAISTMGAILEGKRTATTRYGTANDGKVKYWRNAKVGDIITFDDGRGKQVKVRVTVPLHKLDSNTDAEEWSKKEGWSVDYFNENVLPRIKAGEAWQMEFELVNEAKGGSIEVNSHSKKYALLSNFGDKSFTDEQGRTFKTVEHYFHWCKAIHCKDFKMANAILKAPTAKAAKYLGSHVLKMDKSQAAIWDKSKSEHVMRKGMRMAFEQNENAKQLLLSTGNAMLTHSLGGPFADILMELREEFGGYGKPESIKEAVKEAKKEVQEAKQAPKAISKKKGVTKIISGGQTGVDTLGLEVGKELGIQTGGTTTPGFVREKGVDSYTKEQLKEFGLEEISSELQGGKSGKEFYLPRTEQNVINSDGTVYFATDEDSAGKIATERFAKKHGKPFLLNPSAEELEKWIDDNDIQTLNVAGNRGSKLEDDSSIRQVLKAALSKTAKTATWVRRKDKQLKIDNAGYSKGDPQRNTDTAYVFTDNAQAYVTAQGQNDDWIEEGYNKGMQVKTGVSDMNGTNQAGIRASSSNTYGRTNISPNAFGIVVKKYQQKIGEEKMLSQEGLFQDTEEDFELFKRLNEDMFDRLTTSGLKKIVFPSQMAMGKAALPKRFAEWLSVELGSRFGIITEIQQNTKAKYKGYGLNITGIVEAKVDSSLHVEKLSDRYTPAATSDVEIFNEKATTLREQGWHVEFYKKKSKNGSRVNDVMTISLEGNPKKGFFELVKDTEENNYSVHFKTKSKKALNESTYAEEALEDLEKENLFKALIFAIPDDGVVSTWGELSKGGVAALDSLAKRSGGTLSKIADRVLSDKESKASIVVPVYKKLTEEEFVEKRVNQVKMSNVSKKKPWDNQFSDDYFGIQQSTQKLEPYTGVYTITLNEPDITETNRPNITNGSKDRVLKSLVSSVPYSSIISLSTKTVNANFLYTLLSLIEDKRLFAHGNETITIDPNSADGMIAAEYAKTNKHFLYNSKTGELVVPRFTVGYSVNEIAKRASYSKLMSSDVLSQEELRSLSKATVYKVSEFITMLQSYKNGYETLFGESTDKDFTQMSRVEIIREIGLTTLFNKVRDRVFDSEVADATVSEETRDKMDFIYENWDAFIELGYDTLIGLEEIALDDRHNSTGEIKNDLDDVNEETDEAIIQELFGSSVENWQVGFRQVSAFNSLSTLIKRVMDSLYSLDSEGNQIIDEFGLASHLSAQEAVAKILHYTQGALSLDARDSENNLLKNSMVSMLKEHLAEEPWLKQVIDLLEDKYNEQGELVKRADEQFKSQFYSNFKKYFQKYAVTVKTRKKITRYGDEKAPNIPTMYANVIQMKVINESAFSDTLLNESKAKEASFALGYFKLKTKEGKINKENLSKLRSLAEKLEKMSDKTEGKWKQKDEIIDLNEYHKAIEDVLDLLDITSPPSESLYRIFGVKKNLKDLIKKLSYLLDEIKDGVTITNNRDYQQIVQIVSKEMGLEMEAVSYEAGKLYYSYVMPSYLGKLIGKLSKENMSDEEYEAFLQNEYLKYQWFYKDGKVRCRWLDRLRRSKEARDNFKHVTSLHFLGKDYQSKSPVEYIASMMRMYFYDNNKKWAYFRVPMLSNKPSEEYIKFERITTAYRDTITRYMWDVFLQELDRIQAVRERQNNTNADQKIKNFDTKGLEFVFEDYLQKYLDGTFATRPDYEALTDEQKAEELEFSILLNKKLDEGLSEDSDENGRLMILFNTMTQRGFDENYAKAKQQWIDEGFITLDEEGKIKKIFNGMKLSEDDLMEFYWNDAFASVQILQLTITDLAYYADAEDLQKRLAQLHAPGMQANILAKYQGEDGEMHLYTEDGIERTIYIKDDKIKSNVLDNLTKAVEQIINDTPEDRKKYVREQLESVIKEFKKINFADAQGYSCPSSYRKKLGVFGNWDAKMENAYQKLMHPEKYPDVQLSDLLDVLWQPLKPFVYTQISKPGYNSLLPEIKVGVQNKNSEYTLLIADALMRRGKVANKLSAIYDFMEESQHNADGTLNGKGIDTIQFESTVKVGLTGVIDLNDERDKEGNIIHYKTEDEIREALGKAYSFDENGVRIYSPDYVHEIPFEDYIIQQNVPAHFREHQQAHGSQDRILTFADILDVDPKTGETNYLIIDGQRISVADAKKQYFDAISDNIEASKQELIERFNLNSSDTRETNVAISRALKDAILKDARFGSDLLWACDTDEFGEFNIPLSDPIQSNRIQQLLNSIIKNTINKQEIAGGPVVQVSSWGVSDELAIRYKTENGQLLLTRREFDEHDFPKDYVDKYKSMDGYVDYESYIEDQAGVAYFEAYVPIQDSSIVKDFTKVDANGNEYIDVEAMEKANPDLLNMIGYRIPTESKYSMVPIKVKGFLPRNSGEGIMLPAEITTMSGSDFDIDKLYIMRYTFNRFEKNGKVVYEKPTSGKGYRDNLIISTQLAVLQSKQVQKQLFTPGNFDAPKHFGYLISYVQNEVAATGKAPEEVWQEAENWNNDTLKDNVKTSKNIIFNNVQVQFHKQNMTAGKLIGIFAQANVSHAFISLVEGTTLIIPEENSFTLNGVRVGGEDEFLIDEVLTKDRSINISNNLAALLAASVDAVKDPILNLININIDTANLVTSLLRMGFSMQTVSLLCAQPVIKDLVKEYNIKRADGVYVDINSIIDQKIEMMSDDTQLITDINTNDESLIENLDGHSENTNYMVLQIFRRMLDVSDAFGDITHMTRYNSVTSAVGPFASNTALLRIKDRAFDANPMIGDRVKEACNNPILVGFRDGSDYVERRLLGEHLIQAGTKFNEALDTLGKKLGFSRGVPAKVANAFSDFYMSWYVNAGRSSVFDLDYENRKYMLQEFPRDFIKMKEKIKDNILINSIQYVETDREQFPFLKLNTRGVSSTLLEDLKRAWISLYDNPNTRGLAMRLVEYNFFRGSFGFSPKTFMNLTPNIIKSNLPNYINVLNNRESAVEIADCTDRIIHQFILHNEYLIVDRFKKLEDYSPSEIEDPVYGTCILCERKADGKKKKDNIETQRPFIEIDGKAYFVVENRDIDTILLKPVDLLGGDSQGFEMSTREEFPKSVFDQDYKPTSKDSSNNDGGSFRKSKAIDETIKVLMDQLFQDSDSLREITALGPKSAINRINKELSSRGIDYQLSTNQKTLKSMYNTLEKIKKVEGESNIRELLNKSQKTIKDLNLCD